MAIYDTGTASLAANGQVTGVGTQWTMPLTLIRVGSTLVFKTEPVQIYTISEITSDTSMAVYNPNGETVPVGTGYAILAHDGISVQGLAQDVAETLRYYQSRETEVSTAVDIFKDFDQDKFSNDVSQVNTQFVEIVTIAAQVSSDASQVSTDKDAAAASASSASTYKDAAAESALEAADYAASLDTQNLLRKDLAFSDLTDKPLARQNIDVYSRMQSDRYENQKQELIAHRGFSLVFPENTMAAMEGSLSLGANALECDISITLDGIPVLMHDENVSRTTNGTGITTQLQSSYVLGLDAGSKFSTYRYAGEPVPLLYDVLLFCKSRGCKIYAELAHLRSTDDASIVVDMVKELGMENLCVLCAADISKLQKVRELDKDIAVGYLIYGEVTDSVIQDGKSLGKCYIQFQAWRASKELLKKLEVAGLQHSLWTLDTPVSARLALSHGFNKFMFNEPIYSFN
ncbi:tail fiber protein [Escherichia phage DTL]|uniref:Putative tail fiber protein n=1 Tax=Escherichia phage DTL TaxID=2048061 RepID=A0A2H4PGQ5_9CAUD|nr:tail fiber protein [Escherichia phage DTL]ATW61829.1 putative tail fiber protein [Escherichia phage DTL]